MTAFSVDDIPWGAPKVIETKVGPRRVREWRIPSGHAFWDAWRTGYLKQLGYSISKFGGEWRVTEWRLVDGSDTDTGPAVHAARQRDDIQHRSEQVEPELPDDLVARFNEVCAIYQDIKSETGDDYDYQLPSIRRLAAAVDAFDGALDASDTGVGKTPVACAVAKVLGRTLFVVCPKNVMTPWRRMARRFGVRIEIINYEKLRTGNTAYGAWTYERNSRTGKRFRRFLFGRCLDRDEVLFVFDECHRMKDPTTLNTNVGVNAIEAGYKVMGLSATAADNPMQMKFVALLTGLIQHPSHFHGWMTSHGVKKGRWGWEFVGGREVMAKLHKQIFPARGSRIRIADLGDRFPQRTIICEAYSMGGSVSDQIQTVYSVMHKEIAKLEASKRKDKSACIRTEILRARQLVELLKVPTLVQMVKDGTAEGMAVALILNFQASIDAAARLLRTTNTITGQREDADPIRRQRLIDRFNADDENTVVANIKCGGLGIGFGGTREGKPRLGLISPSYSADEVKQAVGRFPRADGTVSIVKIVFAADTIEERACDKAKTKIRRIDTLNDGDLAVTGAFY